MKNATFFVKKNLEIQKRGEARKKKFGIAMSINYVCKRLKKCKGN